MDKFETSIYFRCPNCRASDIIQVEVPEFMFSSDKVSDHISEGTVYVLCPYCDSEFEANAQCNASGCDITLVDYGNIHFRGDSPQYSPDMEEYWSEYEPENEPKRYFDRSISGLREILSKNIANWSDRQLLNRMIFSQAITSLESYFFNRILRDIVDDPAKLHKFLSSDKYINEEKFSLREINKSPDLVISSVKSYLGKVLYHNLERVRALYLSTYAFDIAEDKEQWRRLQKAMPLRHDCVHRNGFDKDGNVHTIFETPFVINTVDDVCGIVELVDTKTRINSYKDWLSDDDPFAPDA